MANMITTTEFPGLSLLQRGKVRDMYDLGDALLMVATDRISAFDVVMDNPIPEKGAVLTKLSLFWLDYLSDIIPHHLITADVEQYPEECAPYRQQLVGRSMLVKKAQPLPVECIVRGYISGSFWSSYKKSNIVCGFTLPENMKESEQFPETLFTPSTKAELGRHDENISVEQMAEIVGSVETAHIADVCVRLYEKAARYARERGIIIADTKFELGWYDGELLLIDEVLTPDSSRFWPKDTYEIGRGQASFDKQFLRDYLLSLDWDKTPPAPELPADIVEKTAARYMDALKKITGGRL